MNLGVPMAQVALTYPPLLEPCLNDSKSKGNKALFTSIQKLKNFQDSPSHRIFIRMHEVLNVDKNKN
jgi:hypothetical protein